MNWNGLLTKNYAYEVVACWHRWDVVPILNFDLRYKPRGTDHRGVYFLFAVGRFQFEANVYNTHHADEEDTGERSEP